MKLRNLLVLVTLCTAIMVSGALAQDTCYVKRNPAGTTITELDLGVCDTVRIADSICVRFTGPNAIAVGDSFKVPFLLYCSDSLGAFALGFTHDGAPNVRWGGDWEVDANSWIPLGARSFKTPTRVSANGDSILIGWSTFSPSLNIPPTAGGHAEIIGSLFLKVLQATPDTVHIDSTFMPPAAPFQLTAIYPTPPRISKKLSPHYDNGGPFVAGCDMSVVPVQEISSPNLPKAYSLSQNVPNPFNPSTSIEFAIPRSGEVKIEVFNTLGQKVKTLVDEYMKVGYKRVEWDGTDQTGSSVASGVYLYRMSAKDFGDTKKMLLLK